MRKDIELSSGRIVSHKPYCSNGKPNGAIEAFILEKIVISGVTFEVHKEMSNLEWIEYSSIIEYEVKV